MGYDADITAIHSTFGVQDINGRFVSVNERSTGTWFDSNI